MGIGDNIGEFFAYAKEALVGKWVRWIILFAAVPFLNILSARFISNLYDSGEPA